MRRVDRTHVIEAWKGVDKKVEENRGKLVTRVGSIIADRLAGEGIYNPHLAHSIASLLLERGYLTYLRNDTGGAYIGGTD